MHRRIKAESSVVGYTAEVSPLEDPRSYWLVRLFIHSYPQCLLNILENQFQHEMLQVELNKPRVLLLRSTQFTVEERPMNDDGRE